MPCSFSQPSPHEWAFDSCLQGEYARSVVTWAKKVCGITGWPLQHAALFDLWYNHPAPLKHQPPTDKTIPPTTLLVLSALHIALLHPESSLLILSPSVRQRRVLENLFLLYGERVGLRPWLRISMKPGGLTLTISNASRIVVRTLSCSDDLLRIRGTACDAILIEEQSPSFLTYDLITMSLLPLFTGRAHPQTGSPTLGWCWLFSE